MISINTTRCRRAYNWWIRHNNAVFYWGILIILTRYIILNWDICVSMQFFRHFDGNNILFLCWLLMIFLKIFRIKVKDIEVFRALQSDLTKADLQYNINERQALISKEQQVITGCNQEGAPNNA